MKPQGFLFAGVLFFFTFIVDVTAAPRSLTLATNGQGQISSNPTGSSFPQNSTVTLLATAAQGWQFTGWSGSINGTVNPTNVLMDTDKSITANFSPLPTRFGSFHQRHQL